MISLKKKVIKVGNSFGFLISKKLVQLGKFYRIDIHAPKNSGIVSRENTTAKQPRPSHCSKAAALIAARRA